MRVLGLKLCLRPIPVLLVAGAFATFWPKAAAQNLSPAPAESARPEVSTGYSQPHTHYPNPIAPYTVRHIEPADLENGPRLNSLIKDGKLMLSLNDAIALTLENNLDIAIARDNLNIAQTDVMRAESGSSIIGVNAGVVQNTPGGGVGGLSGTVGSGTGGTSPGSAGAGTGTNGLVNSTLGSGPTITSFDPLLTGTFQMDRDYVRSTSAITGSTKLNTNTGTADMAYTQGLQWGTDVSVTFNNTHLTSTSKNSLFSPEVSPSTLFKVTQPVLQGFGKLPNTRFIHIAHNNLQITDQAFRLQVITTVDQIENLYWDFAYAYQNVSVQQDALDYAQTILKDTRTQVEVGVSQPIQIVNAESTVATAQQALILAQTNLQLQRLLMKNALSRTLVDPSLTELEVVPTSSMEMPEKEPPTSLNELLNQAFANRAELGESRIDLTSRQLSSQAVANALLPIIDPFVYYGGTGIGGHVNPNIPVCSSTVTTRCFNPATGPSAFRNGGPVSYGNALGQTFNGSAPDKGFGSTLDLTLRNREAQANQIRSELEYRQAQLRLQQLENQVRIEVRNAQFDVTQNRASVESAKSVVDLAGKSLYAEKRKLEEGTSDPDNVLQLHSALVSAEVNLSSALAAYEKAKVVLFRATGVLLDRNGILISDAKQGHVSTPPNAPDIGTVQAPTK
jgi:outer membrane protein